MTGPTVREARSGGSPTGEAGQGGEVLLRALRGKEGGGRAGRVLRQRLPPHARVRVRERDPLERLPMERLLHPLRRAERLLAKMRTGSPIS